MNKIRVIAALAVVAAGASPAFAADNMPSLYTKAPMSPVPQTWTGFYAGLTVGGGISSNSLTNARAVPAGDSPSGGITITNGTTNGAIGGALIGYNLQSGPMVWGIEAEFDGSGLHGHNLYRSFGASGDVDSKTTWIGTLTARVGTTFHNDMLIYAKAGGVVARNTFDISAQNSFTAGVYPTTSETRFGWTLGFGTEYRITSNWSAKFEYDYLDFGSKDLTFAPGTDAGGGFPTTNGFTASSNQQMHLVKTGLNYKFQ